MTYQNECGSDRKYFDYIQTSHKWQSKPDALVSHVELSLAGIMIDDVDFHTESLDDIADDDATISSPVIGRSIKIFSQWITAVTERWPAITSSFGGMPSGLSNCLHARESAKRPKERPPDSHIEDAWYDILRGSQWPLDNGLRDPVDGESEDLVKALGVLGKLQDSPEVLQFHMNCCNKLRGKRTLFITSDGRLGTGPLSMRRGDIIALVAGLRVPLALRPKFDGTDRCILVGPAFIPELMKGPVWEGVNRYREIILV